MATTTNYNWTTPDDTDLVKDGASAIRTLGSSADTTVKNLNPGTTAGDIDYYTSGTAKARIAIGTANQVLQVNSGATAPEWGVDPVADVITTAGDLIYGTAADTVARLGIGTAGQVLKVNSGATAPEWGAAASAGALAFISRTTFSNVATQDFDSVFSSTYGSSAIIVEQIVAATAADDLQIQFRAAGSTLTSGYYGNAIECNFGSSTVTNNATSNASALMLTTYAGPASENSAGFIEFTNVGDAALRPVINWHFYIMSDGRSSVGGGQGTTTGTTYTGFRLKSSSSNISGTVAIYGRTKS